MNFLVKDKIGFVLESLVAGTTVQQFGLGMGGKTGFQSVDFFGQIALQFAGFHLRMKKQVGISSKFPVTIRTGHLDILI